MMNDDWYPSRPKRPPKHGIKVQKIGATWWGQRWIESLERMSRDYVTRLGRGRTYARTGRVHDLDVKPGKVTARVTGSRPEPYEVELQLPPFDAATWDKAIAAMAQKALFTAELLAGRMPANINEAFRAAGHSLFPTGQRELQTDCSCPDWASPCKHVAAVHYVLADAFDRDPFLLFELRGCDKEQVLTQLSLLRGGSAAAAVADTIETIASLAITNKTPQEYDRPPAVIPKLNISFTTPTTSAAILRQLGPLSLWSLERTPADALALVYDGASELARELALGGEPKLPARQSTEQEAEE